MPKNLAPTSSPSPQSPAKSDKRIDLLFAKFAAFYGHLWRSQFKDEGFLTFAKKEWQESLTEFSDRVLINATASCREFYDMPPTLPQMIQSCRQMKRQTSFEEAPAKPEYLQGNKDIAAFYLQQCREKLAGK